MNLRITPRVRRIQHSPTLWIHQRVKELRKEGDHVVHFGFGESPFPPPEPFLDALRTHAGESGYLPSQGLMALREQAAEYLRLRFRHDVDPERILVGPGSKELIFDALLALQGDLILPAPSWVSYAPQAHLLDKKVIGVQTDPGRGYRITAEDLGQACRKSSSSQKILILNSPCNPTGAVYSPDELRDIAAVARAQNAIVLSDEIYAEIAFTQHTSITAHCPERTVVTTGQSKGFCAGGHRLGIMAIPQGMGELVPHLVNIASETFSCVSAPIQHAAVVAFSKDQNVRHHVEDTAAIHRIASEYLWRGLTEIGLRCPRPEGAFYLFPDFLAFEHVLSQKGIRTDTDLCTTMLEEQHLAMLPGSAFGMSQHHLAARIATVDYDGAAVLEAFRRDRPASEADEHAFIESNCPNLPEGLRRVRRYLTEAA